MKNRITYKIEDQNGFPVCFGNTQREAIKKARDWAGDYPYLISRPYKLMVIVEKFVKPIKL